MGGKHAGVAAAVSILVALGSVSTAKAAYEFDREATFLGTTAQWAPWQTLFARHAQEQAIIRACLAAHSDCNGPARSYAFLINRARDIDAQRRIRLVNRFVNKRRYRDDRPQAPAIRNEFRTLFDLFRNGGDCEDFAIAKYLLLRELGFSKEELRIVITRVRSSRDHHAVLAVKVDDQAWLLETDDTIKRGNKQNRYRYLFSMNEEGIWDHETSYDR